MGEAFPTEKSSEYAQSDDLQWLFLQNNHSAEIEKHQVGQQLFLKQDAQDPDRVQYLMTDYSYNIIAVEHDENLTNGLYISLKKKDWFANVWFIPVLSCRFTVFYFLLEHVAARSSMED